MPLAEDNDMVKAIPSDRTDEPLRMSVLPWRSWCDRPVPNAHRANATDKDIAIDTIPIANDILRRLLPAVCLGELTRNPLGARMRGHAQPQNLTAGMPQDQKSIQQPERDRGDHEQIHRRDAVRVISKKRLPSLGWRTPSSRHVLGNGGLPDIDAELEQFAMNPRCTPKRVLNTHVSNELTNLQRSLWSATARSRFPPPIGSESGPVPTDHCLRFENFQGIQHAGHKTIQPSKHQAIDALEGRSFGRFALQDVELMAQNKDLRLKPCPRSEEPGQHTCQQHEKIDHRARTSPDSPSAR